MAGWPFSWYSSGSSPTGATAQTQSPQWDRVKAIALRALDMNPVEQERFISHECSTDPQLAAEVRSLLVNERFARGLWEDPLELIGRPPPEQSPVHSPRLEAGDRIGDYRIIEFVSAGGMGEVYAAHDTVLDRKVAIKLALADASDGAAKRQLLREARNASRLAHPNICTIYEAGEADGICFIAMQFIQGEPLVMRRRASNDFDSTVAVALQIVDAVEHAHSRGVVHRDLKSSNIMIQSDGRPVVLDFGIARRISTGDAVTGAMTEASGNSVAGTLSYMAPEVLLGGEADPRSDVWSLGVVIYELFAGCLPFTGRTLFETTYSILHDPPRMMPGEQPAGLRLVIEGCLQKNPAARFATARALRESLDSARGGHTWFAMLQLFLRLRKNKIIAAAVLLVVAGSSAVVIPDAFARRQESREPAIGRVAVLPLEDGSSDGTFTYYARGLSDAFASQLSELSGAEVIAPSSTPAGRGAAADAQLARTLGARLLLSGRLREYGERVIVDVRLVDPRDGGVVWSDSFDRPRRHVLALQADVVHAVAAQIRFPVREGASARLGTVRAVNPEAYEEFLKGRYQWNLRRRESLDEAVRHFQRATELDATFAPAWAALADCYNQHGTLLLGSGSPLEYRPKAIRAAIQALQIDPMSADARAALAYAYHYDWRWTDAEREFRRSLDINPNNALARIWYSNFLASRNRIPEALEQVFAARALDPYSLIVGTNVGWALGMAGKGDEAIGAFREVLALDSTYEQARWRLAAALLGKGDIAEAARHADYLVSVTGRASAALGLRARVSAAERDTSGARVILNELLARARNEYVPPGVIASVHGTLDDTDGHLKWVRRTFLERSNSVVYNPMNGRWKTDQRYRAIIAEFGYQPPVSH